MIWEIKRIHIFQAAKVCFIIIFLAAFVAFLLYGALIVNILHSIGSLMGGLEEEMLPMQAPLVFLAFFISFLVATVETLVIMFILLIYNALSSYIGGIKLELEAVEPLQYPDIDISQPPVSDKDDSSANNINDIDTDIKDGESSPPANDQ